MRLIEHMNGSFIGVDESDNQLLFAVDPQPISELLETNVMYGSHVSGFDYDDDDDDDEDIDYRDELYEGYEEEDEYW